MKITLILGILLTTSAFAQFNTVIGIGKGEGDLFDAKNIAYKNARQDAQERCLAVGGYFIYESITITEKECEKKFLNFYVLDYLSGSPYDILYRP